MNKTATYLKFLALALGLHAFGPGPLHAGAPLKINFQGRLNESGQPAEGSKSFVFKLYDAVSGGNVVWASQAQAITLDSGVFSAVLSAGETTALSTAPFSAACYVEITVDGVPLSPRQEVTSAPYALVAQALAPDAEIPAGSIAAGSISDLQVVLTTGAITSGKFSDDRVLITTGAFSSLNGPDQLVKLDGAGKIPAGNLTESDPVFAAHAANGIAAANITNWDAAYGWGNHATAGYTSAASLANLAASTGTLTINLAAVALSTGPLTNYANWNTAYGWNNHAVAGYANAVAVGAATATLRTDLSAVALSTGPLTNYADWNTAYGWNNHAVAGYANAVAVGAATATLRTDLSAVALSTGPLTNYADWNTAYGWNNHAVAGYANAVAVGAATATLRTDLSAVALSTGPLTNYANWNAAFGWGSHALAGYAGGSAVGTATATLRTDLAAVALSTGPLADYASWNTAFGWGNHATVGYETAAAHTASLEAYATLASTQSLSGSNSFTSASATVPGVTISSGLVVAAGRVGIGTASPSATLEVVTDSAVYFRRNAADALPVSQSLLRSRGTPAAPAALGNGDYIGSLDFTGYDGASYLNYAGVSGIVDGVVSAGVLPTALKFNTGSASGLERMRITSAGRVGIGTAGPNYSLDVQGGNINASGGLCIADNCKSSWASVDNLGNHTASQALDMAGYAVNNVSALTVTGSMSLPIRRVTFADHPYLVSGADYTIVADATDGSFTITLPAAASATGRVYIVKRVDDPAANVVTLDSAGGLVEGAASQAINSLMGESIIVQSDGTDWHALSWYWQ
ncbi:MAG: hypothetical protein A2089_12145 [Elusimicrobia bacterium GWD2_63_28]|nr:MAG: hypothetical protein A2089_12145 [Elusimicrobia bacterium GWD2_63_28]